MSAHEAAVEAMAEALTYRWATEGLPRHPQFDAERALAALVRSEAVRAALVEARCLVLPGLVEKCGGATRGVNVRLHLPCVLAALAPPEAM